ncbi:MAG TPA: PA domain-containing protein [Caulobacteraceae bacterium]|nr:PA domain-containing protein [Caulobacteraceae bacterium]
MQAYDALGEHRTATDTDHATSRWLARRLADAGLATTLQPFAAPLFVPERCELRLAGSAHHCFPGWPVAPTSAAGLSTTIVPHEAPGLAGKIALVRPGYRQGGTWAAPGFGEVAMQAARAGAAAVVVVTDGPTGGVIALNAVPSRFTWPIPVVIAAGEDGDRLSAAAAAGEAATLVSTGVAGPAATATNVVARRRGAGKTLVVSTPMSGWFHCAGERATGIAVFLALAHELAHGTDADLLFVAFSGHELDEMGGGFFLKHGAPTPDRVRAWLHVGANAAMQPLALDRGAARPSSVPGPERRITTTSAALAAAQRAFVPQAGFGAPSLMNDANAYGELSIFYEAGYRTLAGIGGANPLFHTRLDRADISTTPAILETVRSACSDFLRGFP